MELPSGRSQRRFALARQYTHCSLCVTEGLFTTLNCRVYGGAADEDPNYKNDNTATTLKWVNLYDEMLDTFKHFGMCETMDLATWER